MKRLLAVSVLLTGCATADHDPNRADLYQIVRYYCIDGLGYVRQMDRQSDVKLAFAGARCKPDAFKPRDPDFVPDGAVPDPRKLRRPVRQIDA